MAIPSTPRKRVALSEALSVLDAAYPTPDGYMARCPSHDDGRQSLTLSQTEDGRLLAHCFAGCDFLDVLKAITERSREDYEGPQDARRAPSRPSRHVDRDNAGYAVRDHRGPAIDLIRPPRGAEVWEYLTADGDHAFFTIKKTGKNFLQAQYDPSESDGIRWTRDGTPNVPYRFPELIESLRAGLRVWIVEGERDVESLRARGETATCNAGGACKWPTHFGTYFAGATVILITDNDVPGYKHAAAVYESLRGCAEMIRIGRAASGKDATDHLNAGLGLNDFLPVSLPDLERIFS